MHPEQIKAAMRMKGVTPAALADEMLVSSATVSQVISGRSESARIKARIAQIVGMPVASLWAPKDPSPLRRVKAAA
jgi:lambda repressor-like predicted transcriptional regulator